MRHADEWQQLDQALSRLETNFYRAAVKSSQEETGTSSIFPSQLSAMNAQESHTGPSRPPELPPDDHDDTFLEQIEKHSKQLFERIDRLIHLVEQYDPEKLIENSEKIRSDVRNIKVYGPVIGLVVTIVGGVATSLIYDRGFDANPATSNPSPANQNLPACWRDHDGYPVKAFVIHVVDEGYIVKPAWPPLFEATARNTSPLIGLLNTRNKDGFIGAQNFINHASLMMAHGRTVHDDKPGCSYYVKVVDRTVLPGAWERHVGILRRYFSLSDDGAR
jgi:hypothetical protein